MVGKEWFGNRRGDYIVIFKFEVIKILLERVGGEVLFLEKS